MLLLVNLKYTTTYSDHELLELSNNLHESGIVRCYFNRPELPLDLPKTPFKERKVIKIEDIDGETDEAQPQP